MTPARRALLDALTAERFTIYRQPFDATTERGKIRARELDRHIRSVDADRAATPHPRAVG